MNLSDYSDYETVLNRAKCYINAINKKNKKVYDL